MLLEYSRVSQTEPPLRMKQAAKEARVLPPPGIPESFCKYFDSRRRGRERNETVAGAAAARGGWA